MDNLEIDQMSDIYGEMSMVRIRKSQVKNDEISFDSQVHNIYEPEFSTPATSEIDDNDSPQCSFVSEDTIMQSMSESYRYEESEPAVQSQKLLNYSEKELWYEDMKSDLANVIPNHGSERLEGFREPSFELIMKNYDEDALSIEFNRNSALVKNNSIQLTHQNNPSVTLYKNESSNSHHHSYSKYLNNQGKLDLLQKNALTASISVDQNDTSENNGKLFQHN
jgi:hypothetical protein